MDSTKILCGSLSICLSQEPHSLLSELVCNFTSIFFALSSSFAVCVVLVADIDLSTNKEAGYARTVVADLGEPLLPGVFERRGRGNGEADEEDVGLRV